MRALTVFSPAKVNLFLRVLGRRLDGYHEIVTLFHRISIGDRLILRKIEAPAFRLITDHPRLQSVKDNLVYRAYQLLRKTASWKGGVEVQLKKRIPLEAGLGGGSSNAAYFLLGMNRLFRLGLSQDKLAHLAARLGSDAAFFIYGVNQALGTGRGEKIKPLRSKKRFWFALVTLEKGIPTPRVYKGLRSPRLTRISRAVTITSALFAHCKRGDEDRILYNDLYPVSCSFRPELKRTALIFEEIGAHQWLMSGSGPTMFSIHRSKRAAERTAKLLRNKIQKANVFVYSTY